MWASGVVGKSRSVIGKSGRNKSLYYITKMEPENNHLKKHLSFYHFYSF